MLHAQTIAGGSSTWGFASTM